MDSAIAFASLTASVLAALLVLDMVAAVARHRAAIRRGLERPLRVVLGSTICASLLLGAVRPAPAATPPPGVRIVADVESTVGAADDVVPGADAHEQHTVQAGESLWRIARATLLSRGLPATGTDVAAFWPRIYDANRELIGPDPHLIHPGQVLDVPPAGSAAEVAHGA